MIKNVIPTLKPIGGELIELVLENRQDVREYGLLDAARLVQFGGRWDAERVATDGEMMDPSELERARRTRRPAAHNSPADPSRIEILIDGELTNFWGVVVFHPGRESLGDVITQGIRRLIGWKCMYVILNRGESGEIRFQAGAACPNRAFTTGRVHSLNLGVQLGALASKGGLEHYVWEEEVAVLERARSYRFPAALRVATWNVERLRSVKTKRGQRAELFMRSVDADVWVLTETAREMRPGPDFRTVCTAEPDQRRKPDERWAAISSRFPIDREIRTSDPMRAVAALIAPSETRPFLVYGVVLPMVDASWYGAPAAGGQAFEAALARLALDVERIREEYRGFDLFLAGDFNQDLASNHYYGSARRKQRLKEVLGDLGLRPLTAGSDDPIRAASPPYACIDHICASSDWRVRRSVRWPNLPKPEKGKLSDHFGVALEVVRGTE